MGALLGALERLSEVWKQSSNPSQGSETQIVRTPLAGGAPASVVMGPALLWPALPGWSVLIHAPDWASSASLPLRRRLVRHAEGGSVRVFIINSGNIVQQLQLGGNLDAIYTADDLGDTSTLTATPYADSMAVSKVTWACPLSDPTPGIGAAWLHHVGQERLTKTHATRGAGPERPLLLGLKKSEFFVEPNS